MSFKKFFYKKVSSTNDLAIKKINRGTIKGIIVADYQKTIFRRDEKNKEDFIKTGLWSLSRHPNYLGEIILWLGISVISFSSLSDWQYITLISPIFTYLLLVHISGVRILESNGKKKWGHLKTYNDYIDKTPMLLFKW